MTNLQFRTHIHTSEQQIPRDIKLYVMLARYKCVRRKRKRTFITILRRLEAKGLTLHLRRSVAARFLPICLKSQFSSVSIGRLHLTLNARCEYRSPIVQSIIKEFYCFGLTRTIYDDDHDQRVKKNTIIREFPTDLSIVHGAFDRQARQLSY